MPKRQGVVRYPKLTELAPAVVDAFYREKIGVGRAVLIV
jgi:hypothetical protein